MSEAPKITMPELPPMPEPALLKTPADHLGEEYEYTDEAPAKWAWFAHGYDTGMEPFFSAEQVKELMLAAQRAAYLAGMEAAAQIAETCPVETFMTPQHIAQSKKQRADIAAAIRRAAEGAIKP